MAAWQKDRWLQNKYWIVLKTWWKINEKKMPGKAQTLKSRCFKLDDLDISHKNYSKSLVKHFNSKSSHQHVISSTTFFSYLSFHQQVISLTWHSSTGHIINWSYHNRSYHNWSYHQLVISSTGHIINWSLHWLVILLTGHFID
jgi:hypothetical protein